MKEFKKYAQYYDLLYRDKDYSAEASYIHSLLQSHGSGISSLLELGCGTGKHALLLAEAGYDVHGVDASKSMLAEANSRLNELSGDQAKKLSFCYGDIRDYRANLTFDAVISLFHVVSYQTKNADLRATFNTVKSHLNPGGIFVFDFWYGPAVLNDRPVTRIKRLENDVMHLTRIAEPEMFPNENRVAVDYEIFIRDKVSGDIERINETHSMRYLFAPEVDLLLREHGMQPIHSEEWMTGKPIGSDSWGACFVARA